MRTSRLVICGAAAFGVFASAAQARPCSKDIDRMQARIDARLEANATAGPFAPQSIAAGMSVQPTPLSIERAEERLDEISGNKVDMVRNSMAKARAANAEGNERACERALAEVRREMRH